MTEDEVLAALRKHYLPERGNGDEWGFLPKVRNQAGMEAKRTADLIVFGLWPSRGLTVIGHEIKCSRADWLTELRNPAKADAFWPHVDGWYLVVSDITFVRAGELPEEWGLMVVKETKTGTKIKVVTPAPIAPKEERRDTLDRSFVAALMKVSCRTVDATPAEIEQARSQGWESAIEYSKQSNALEHERHKTLEQKVRDFEKASGVGLNAWYAERDPVVVGTALRTVLEGNSQAKQIRQRLERLRDDAQKIVDHAQSILTPTEPFDPEDVF